MQAVQNILSTLDFSFLNEPIHMWALFVVAMTFILWAWRGVLSFME
jgi:hypothetical protein